ncbi:hypothetical protein [Nocardioides sp. SYSU D00038]|uniref:hypothetical protein n=1 Tax=Nocardioides sp. SYSU D00038 TaxID=2812554 RepID=UPI001966DBB4|nr:hypothetical protein [Nocardioides sp. SYSU D00038]
MAQRLAYVPVGLPHSGSDLLAAAAERHRAAFADAGVRLPAGSADEMFRAAVELRRDHRSWGLRRKDVEGVWAAVCRRAHRGRDHVMVGHDLLAGCTPDQVALLVDGLAGFEVHVVVTATAPDPRVTLFPEDHDLLGVLDRWSAAVSAPDRIHVVVAGSHERDDPASAWRALGRVVGVATDGLVLPDPATLRRRADPTALRLMAEATGAMASADDLRRLGERWAVELAGSGHDVHGDPAALVPAPSPTPPGSGAEPHLAGVTEALSATLSETLAEVTRLRERNRELEERTARLERKRNRLKRRLAEAG